MHLGAKEVEYPELLACPGETWRGKSMRHVFLVLTAFRQHIKKINASKPNYDAVILKNIRPCMIKTMCSLWYFYCSFFSK